jgi:exopolysaccharide biosynthesis polyprenyl glycosylphosphotransferase
VSRRQHSSADLVRRMPLGMSSSSRPRRDVTSGPHALAEVCKRERRYRCGLVLADLAAAALSVPLAAWIVGGERVRPAYLLLLPAIVLMSKFLGLYARDELVLRKSTLDELPALANLSTAFSLVVCVTRGVTLSGPLGAYSLVALWVTTILVVGGARDAARRVAALISPVERCLLLGKSPAVIRLRSRVLDQPRVSLVGSIGFDEALQHHGTLERMAVERGAHRIVIVPDDTLQASDAFELVRVAKATGMRVSLLPGILEAVGSSVVCDDLGGLTLIGVPRFGLSRSSTTLKRAFDLLASGAILLAAAPLMLVIAVLIRLDTPGPVLFRQTRVGRDGQLFSMLKLRTMVDGADAMKANLRGLNEAVGLFKIAADPRITRVGRWLRCSNLDELPQLINVLRGEMSLVGPRPLVVDEDERIVGLDRGRLLLTPGMTGPWQTTGTKRVPLTEMVKLDYLYIANWSLWSDVKIMLRTVPHVAQRRGQ